MTKRCVQNMSEECVKPCGINSLEYLKNFLELNCKECEDEMRWGLFHCANVEELDEEFKKMSIIHRTRLAGRYDAYYRILQLVPELMSAQHVLEAEIRTLKFDNEALKNKIELLKRGNVNL